MQNIDVMIVADFCRNCLAKWYKVTASNLRPDMIITIYNYASKEGVEQQGGSISYEEARERVYGEPFESWKAKHQKPATPEQLARMDDVKKRKMENSNAKTVE